MRSDLKLGEPRLESWLRMSLDIPADRFVSTAGLEELLVAPFRQSRAGMGFYLKKEVDPYRQPDPVSWTARAADPGGMDLLRCRYAAAGLRFELREGPSFLVVQAARISQDLAEAEDRRAYLRDLIATAMATDSGDHHWEFELPEDLDQDGSGRLITSLGAPDIRWLQAGEDRADVLVWSGEIYFLFYKKIRQYVNFRPDDEFFSPEARAALQSRQARQEGGS